MPAARRWGTALAGALLAVTALGPATTAFAAPGTPSAPAKPTTTATPKSTATSRPTTAAPKAPATPGTSASRPGAAPRAGELVDTFDGPAGSAANPNVWGYDTGRGFEGWGNWEKQFYTDSRNNSWLDGQGHLVIQAKYEAPGGTLQYGDDEGNAYNWETQWTSARLVTRGKFDFTYGRAEARIKVPQGAGMWPAFWALGSDNVENPWPNSGELDIFEGASWRPDANLSNVFGGNAWDDLRMIDGWTDQGAPLGGAYHTVALEKTPDTLQFFFDGKLHHEVTRANMGSDWRFDKPVFLVLNVAVGGNFGGAFDANSGADSTMLVDHVKVTGPQGTQTTGPLEISRKWSALGGLRGKLGDTPRDKARTRCDLARGGCVQQFTGGLGYWSPATGAHPVWGEIGKKYAALGWETSRLGYPTSDEICGLKGGGCVQRFEGGNLYWSPATGAQPVWGAIADGYAEVSWENSPLGYPTGPEFCGLKDGGCAQRFTGGLVYFSMATGAHAVYGEIGRRYADVRWENSPLGYPTGREFCGLKDGGCGQAFSGGLIYWSPKVGANPVWGRIGQRYGDVGWERSPLGYPTSGEFCGLRDGGCGQRFEGGYAYWTLATDAHPVWGAIATQYAAQGWEQGALRYPVTDEIVTSWGWEQRFQGGVLTWRR